MPRPGPAGGRDPGCCNACGPGRTGVVLVCGRPGIGKSTCPGDWVRGEPPAVVVVAGCADNDPARFWRYVAAAVDHVRSGNREQVGAARNGARTMSSPRPRPSWSTSRSPAQEVAVVLDDYHMIHAAAVHRLCGSCWTTCRPRAPRVASRATHLGRCPGCGPAGKSPSSRRRAAVHGPRDRGTAAREERTDFRPRAWPPSPSGPRAGSPGFSWRPSRSGTRRRRRVRRGVLRQPPLRPGLSHRGGAGSPVRECGVPARDLDPATG